MENIDIGLEQRFCSTLTGIHPDWIATEDSGRLDPITRSADVYQLIIDAEGDGVGCLAIWHQIRSFLELDDLFIGENAAIMNQLHRVLGFT
jgi:hypothetical protein